MTSVVLTVLAGWLLLSLLAAALFAAVARGGRREDCKRLLTAHRR
jgi:membrane protein YqaA with SNARE-associated domain